CQQQKSYPRTF
nr:immunoglobulin light chain junction region [Macaca mulatta]MOV63493.1 immunoglobulin light chain junction region [Macaca mulatta]